MHETIARPGETAAHGESWVLLVTNGLTVEFPPELYRDRDLAESECERWAYLLSAQSGQPIVRPFEGRWQVADRWIRLVHSFLAEDGTEVWVGTYWGRDGSPEPEAELFADREDARTWVLEAPPGGVAIETHETRWSAATAYQVRGGQEEAEIHRAKIVAAPPLADGSRSSASSTIYGFEEVMGLIPQGPLLFSTEEARDSALRDLLEDRLTHGDWRAFVQATAEGNYLNSDPQGDWDASWTERKALEWLLGFDYIADGDDLEIRRFETSIT